MSIRVLADGFSLSIHKGRDGSLVQTDRFICPNMAEMPRQMEWALRRPHLMMDYHFSSVQMTIAAPSTCIPLEYFRKGDITGLYKMNYPDANTTGTELQYQLLTQLEVAVIFRMQPTLLKVVQDIYPDVQVNCTDAELLEQTARLDASQRDGEIHFYAHVLEQQLMICALREQHLHYTATFRTENDSDRLYYLLGVWKTLQLDAERNRCNLSGASDTLLEEIRKYILKVKTIQCV